MALAAAIHSSSPAGARNRRLCRCVGGVCDAGGYLGLLLVTLMAAGGLVASGVPAHVCSCVGSPASWRGASAVFVARVVESDRSQAQRGSTRPLAPGWQASSPAGSRTAFVGAADPAAPESRRGTTPALFTLPQRNMAGAA